MGGVDAACALHSRVGSFTLLVYRHVFALEEGRGPWVRAKAIISDRDRGRLCEKVFMCVCVRRRQGSLAGGFNSK